MTTSPLSLAVPPELFEALAARAAELVADHEAAAPELSIGVEEEAEYVACKPQRIYSLSGETPTTAASAARLDQLEDHGRWAKEGSDKRRRFGIRTSGEVRCPI